MHFNFKALGPQDTNRSTAMEFLLAQGFSIDTMCKTGIRYLSREEEASAIQIAVEKSRSRTNIPDIKVQEDDIECLKFLQSSRLTINEWLAEGEVSISSNI